MPVLRALYSTCNCIKSKARPLLLKIRGFQYLKGAKIKGSETPKLGGVKIKGSENSRQAKIKGNKVFTSSIDKCPAYRCK